MAYVHTANRTIERSPNVPAIGADYRACQESLRRRGERELVGRCGDSSGDENIL